MTVESFLQRRNNAYERVLAAAEEKGISLIPTYLGAEAALAPGFSRIDGIEKALHRQFKIYFDGNASRRLEQRLGSARNLLGFRKQRTYPDYCAYRQVYF
ncbi:MAG: hypothetical protein L6V93_23050 [Clostridiales bacterium]|nr:MAG: hypothetical protein L6V93_23050 [Clostridiales bacterium]